MARNFFQQLILIFSAFSILVPSAGALRADFELRKLLPNEQEAGEWKSSGPPQVFKGEDLFTYIDGGAEIYYEYGFRQVLVQDYRNAKGRRISLEIFEMASPESAYGMYTFKTHPDGQKVEAGEEAQIADYYLNLRKGNFLLTLTGLEAEKETQQDLIKLAKAVDIKLPPGAGKPRLVSLFPEEGLRETTLKFFKGNLGLYNTYPFFRTDVFAFERAAKADYRSGYSLFIFEYGEGEAAKLKFAKVRENFRREGRYSNVQELEGSFQAKDEKGRLIVGSVTERYILVLVGIRAFEEALEIQARVERSIKAAEN